MELNTRCPECGTVFPASLEQMKLRKGYIRCVNCANIFDGFEFVVQGEAPDFSLRVQRRASRRLKRNHHRLFNLNLNLFPSHPCLRRVAPPHGLICIPSIQRTMGRILISMRMPTGRQSQFPFI
ncbi:MAG: hypothetical protein H5U29_13295 [Pusillimonas sp.]|nr:hypothetical protein [Pusillimonas sp.]